jgi:serine/threonine-protein kinase HipA
MTKNELCNSLRVHQEDFCQALGIVSDKKYQKGGGASLKMCFSVIDNYSDNKLQDINRFLEWVVFNYLIGNTDAHAKNLSLIYNSLGIKLAPFYDLLTIEVYPEKLVDHKTAMLINGKGKYETVRQKDFVSLFESFGLNAVDAMKNCQDKFEDIVNISERLRTDLEYNPIYDKIINIIDRRYSIFRDYR